MNEPSPPVVSLEMRLACVEHAKVHEVRSYHPDSVASYVIGHAVLYPVCDWRPPYPPEAGSAQ